MATDTTVNNLIINKLTKAQYDAIASPSDTELYLVPDEIDNVPTSGSDNPVKSGGVYTALTSKADKTAIMNHGTSDTTYSVTPNIMHIWGTVPSLAITLGTPTDATIVNEYMIQFESGSTATTLSLPSSVEWAESCGSLSVETNKTYQISIVNNIGLWASIANS